MSGLERKISIFELTNAARREVYVGVSDLPIKAVETTIFARPPLAVRHWDWTAREGISFREVTPPLPERDAGSFIRAYASSLARSDWKVLRDP